MNGRKCPRCGLVNFATDEACKRCGEQFTEDYVAADLDEPESTGRRKRLHPIIRRGLVVVAVTLGILFLFYASLLKTSEPLSFEQQQMVARSIAILDEKGFGQEAFVLRNLVAYRSTDNWWNRWTGHQEAYAAVNFPFEVVTLYYDFFNHATDDTERALILLHESYHLKGSGEPVALEETWRNRKRLGWTKELYEKTKVWRNTRELTLNHVPQLFQCGLEKNLDCTE